MIDTIESLKKLKSFHNGSYGAELEEAIKAIKKLNCIEKCLKDGIMYSSGKDDYMTGLRNGIRWALSVVNGEDPEYDEVRKEDK